jgi:hypothetical protein
MDDETPDEAIENYNAWIELALQMAERGEFDELRGMVDETPFRSSYLYCLVAAHHRLLRRYAELERGLTGG